MSGGADIVSNMSSIIDVFTALDVAAQAAGAVDWDALPAPELLDALDRLETVRRRATASSHDIAAAVGRRDEQELGGICHTVIADVLRISVAESKRRLRDARQLRPRASLTGQSLPPELPATAKAWNAGILDTEHLRAIQKFMRDLPDHIPSVEVEKAEAFLAGKATELRPDQLEKVAEKLAITINPDGRFSDEDRARQRGFSWCGAQRADGMSAGKLIASPELRAMIDALLAKFAAPGMCNPADQSPMVTGEPSQEVIDRDARSHSQRQHDALAALFRSQQGDPKLGRHRGTSGHRHRLHDARTTAGCCRLRGDRRGHADADGGSDPDGQPRVPLPVVSFTPTASRCSTSAEPNASPPPTSEWSCTPRITAAPPQDVTYPPSTADRGGSQSVAKGRRGLITDPLPQRYGPLDLGVGDERIRVKLLGIEANRTDVVVTTGGLVAP